MFARRTARRNSENDKDPLPFVSDNLKSPFQSSSSRNFVACVREATDERRRQSPPTLFATRAAAATHTRLHARTSESVLMRGLGAAHIAHTPSSGCTPFEFPIPCAASALARKFLAARRFSPRVSCVRVHACACVSVASREVSAQSAQDWICTSRGGGEGGRRARGTWWQGQRRAQPFWPAAWTGASCGCFRPRAAQMASAATARCAKRWQRWQQFDSAREL